MSKLWQLVCLEHREEARNPAEVWLCSLTTLSTRCVSSLKTEVRDLSTWTECELMPHKNQDRTS